MPEEAEVSRDASRTLDRWRDALEPAKVVLLLGWIAVAMVPVVSGYSAARGGWTPVGDNGLIAARTLDTFTSDIQLVGMQTSLGLYADAEVYHAGPLGYWLLAPFAEVFGEPGYGLIVGAVALNVACILAIAALVRGHRRVAVEPVALVLVALVVLALGGERLREPFNPYLGALPLLLCFVASWGVLAGRHRQLPVAVLAGSFAAQIHLSYLLLAGVSVVLAFVMTAIDARRAEADERRRLWRRTIPLSLALGVLCWIGPLIDQLFGTGNLTGLIDLNSVTTDSRSWGFAMDRLLDTVSPYPEWASGHLPRFSTPNEPGTIRSVVGVVCLAAMAATTVIAPRRGQRPLGALAGLSLVLFAIASNLMIRVPAGFGQETFDFYRLFWIPIGAMGTAALLWTVVWAASEAVAFRANRSAEHPTGDAAPDPRRRAPQWASVGLACLAVGLTVPVSVASHDPLDGGREPLSALFGDARVHAARVAELPEAGDGVAIGFDLTDGRSTDGINAGLLGHIEGLVAQLRLMDIEVNLIPNGSADMGIMQSYLEDHTADGSEGVVIVYRVGSLLSESDAPEGYSLLSTYDQRDPIDRYKGYDGQYFYVLAKTAVFVKETG